MNNPIDILILSNGPGELATWVKPVVIELRRQLGDDRAQVRISVVLAPCANASGQEVEIARRYPEVDRIQGADHFLPFLLFGKTQADWDWRDRGVVLFLGGDQFFPVVIGKRLGYRTVIYAEWEARWHQWVNRFGVMKPEILTRVAPKYAHKFAVVGDLMAEAGGSVGDEESRGDIQNSKFGSADSPEAKIQNFSTPPSPTPISNSPIIGLLPGSKPMKLMLGVPLTLAIADQIHQQRPDVQFVIPVAPTLTLEDLATYAHPDHNPAILRFGWATGELVMPEDERSLPYLKTPAGVRVTLWTEFPAYDVLAPCSLCLTTVGANTAELGALAIPMIVLIPTQQLDVMRAWDGIPGLLVNLPGIGSKIAKLINWMALQRIGLLAWPNIWAQREIVPEMVGKLEPAAIAAKVLHYLENPTLLDHMRYDLQSVRGETGAAKKLVQLVCEELQVQQG
ncbi:MAG: lipid-A-disaccharide synthase [Oscillatoriales cyanobacterium C42_A2020_001]|nr:lipid-A-disaccharide synthase [Leptolyngbyaceae cyanobacterium C42_A2020_001]